MIEAKSINKATSVADTYRQLESYIQNKCFAELDAFKDMVYGITLTKYPAITRHSALISITWSDVITALHSLVKKEPDDVLLNDYFYFLTTINGAMKFYEKEVYSIPTSEWSSTAIEKYGIYECPNAGKYLIKYKPLYLAFRKSQGGVMEYLYPVDEIVILNFKGGLDAFLADEKYQERDRVKQYADYMLNNGHWPSLPGDDKQVFILSRQTIPLPKQPRPQRNNSFRSYYTLSDLMTNEICGMPLEEQQAEQT